MFPPDRPNLPTENSFVIMIRKLPSSTSKEALNNLLAFTKDLVSADKIPNQFPEDSNHVTALARFHSSTAANEARALLNGKPNALGNAEMIVDVVALSPGGSYNQRRNTLEQRSPDSLNGGSNGQLTRQSSKFNDTFQKLDPSPPRGQSFSSGELPKPMFSPQSPLGQPLERQRVSGKSVIEDGDDDETGKLLHESVAFAQNDMTPNTNGHSRRPNIPQIPIGMFASMGLNSPGMPMSPSGTGMTSPRGPMPSPTPFGPPGIHNMGPNQNYQIQTPQQGRYSQPPPNPADSNPPCNTLYVGNLPMDASEDELKALFSKQRGYKRLCFRAKTNGPMCFVEFEDIPAASKVLEELYGRQLSNSVKSGIRLSFSKNPLGVRGGQTTPMGPPPPISPQSPMSGMNGIGARPSFATVGRPPPGLAGPPGLINTNGANMNVNGIYGPHATSMNGAFHSPISPIGTTTRSPTMTSMYNGWDGHQRSFHDYMGER